MALRIIYGKAGSGKSQYIYEEINEQIKCAKKNRSQMHGQKRTGPKCTGKKEPVPNAR